MSCLWADLAYLAQPRVLKPSITAWLVTSFQTALLGTAEHLITGCEAPTDRLVKLQVVLPQGHIVLGGYQIGEWKVVTDQFETHQNTIPLPKKKPTKNKRVGIYSENFCVIWVFFQCWPSFISEFLHVSEPQESARSATWFKSNNNECAAHILYTSTLSHHLRTAFISLQQRLD